MNNVFSRRGDIKNMVLESCTNREGATDILCIECGWEGHNENHDDPILTFFEHTCKLRSKSHSNG